MPLPGVSVVVKGTTRGTQTDFDGKYSIKATQGETLEFSYMGFATQSVAVGASSSVSVVMKEDTATDLSEVVVVAYGAQKKETLTGSVGEVKAEALTKITTGNVTQGLVGKVAGVQVFNNNGMPGDAPIIRFRGIGSLSGVASPLYVVDGVPFNGDVASINSQDIESMSFLKDASAAALYGNRGANGVIIITTKKGKNQKSVMTIDTRTGFATRAVPEYDIMTGQKEYYEGFYKVLKNTLMFPSNGAAPLSESAAASAAAATLINGGQGLGYNAYAGVADNALIDPTTGKLNPLATSLKYNEKYADFLFGDGLFTQTNFSVQGGNETNSHFFSVGYEKNEGYVVNSGFEKITARLKLDTQVNDRIKVGGNIGYSHIMQNYLDGYTGGGAYSSPFAWTRGVAPIYPVYLYDAAGNPVLNPNSGAQLFDDGTGQGGSPVRPYGSPQNPYATAINDIKQWETDNLFVNGFAELKIVDGLKFTYTATGDLQAVGDRSMDTPLYGDAAQFNGRVRYDQTRRFALTQQQLLNYNKRFGNHGLDVLVAHETFETRNDNISMERTQLFFPDSPYVDHAALNQGNGSGSGTYATEGYFSRLMYDYDNKYFINGSVRRDGSSRFHPDNRWGVFYGIGASWRISQEAFLKDVSWLNELKLKASYGEQGNDNLGLTVDFPDGRVMAVDTPYLNQFIITPVNTFPAGSSIAFDPVFKGNKDISWEKNANFNAGFDISILDRRLNLEVEYFERKVTDMLFLKPLPISSGFAYEPQNIGDMENVGFEVTLDGTIINGKDFQLSANFNATHYKNKITKLPDNGKLDNEIIVGGGRIRREGGDAYEWYMREFAGVNPSTGAALFWTDDVNNPGQRTITENYVSATQYRTGKTALVDVYGGFGFDAKYKGFDASIAFAYQMGGYAYDSSYMGFFAPERGNNLHRDLANTWSPDNTTATLPRVNVNDTDQNYSLSTLGLIKSDYLSIQNVSVGYTLNSDFFSKMGVSKLRFYGLVDNVALWTKRKGFDPRLGGVTGNSDDKYSLLRNMSVGLNIQF